MDLAMAESIFYRKYYLTIYIIKQKLRFCLKSYFFQ